MADGDLRPIPPLCQRERMVKGIARELGQINWAQDAIDVHHGEISLIAEFLRRSGFMRLRPTLRRTACSVARWATSMAACSAARWCSITTRGRPLRTISRCTPGGPRYAAVGHFVSHGIRFPCLLHLRELLLDHVRHHSPSQEVDRFDVINDFTERTWTRVAITEASRGRRKTAAGGRREERRRRDRPSRRGNEPADHRVSTLIKFVVPGHPTGTPAVMTTVSPGCTRPQPPARRRGLRRSADPSSAGSDSAAA